MHDETVLKIVTNTDSTGRIKSRECNNLEYKETFGQKSWAKYAKTMAAFANRNGGYILFGIKDNPRQIVGANKAFSDFPQEKFTDYLNQYFSPELDWETGIVETDDATIGYIYTEESIDKPVIAQKAENSEKINSGDVFYRYRGRSEKIRFPEMNRLIQERTDKVRDNMLKLLETMSKSGTSNLGIVNYSNGTFKTPNGVDVAFDRKLVAQVLKKAKYIKEGSFNETEGTPVIKVTGNIDLAEEIPVLDLEPDKGYPYIQKMLAENLKISTQDLYALIWYYKMKEAKKYHIEVTTSKTNKVHKFSEFAFQFLKEKLDEIRENVAEFNRIKEDYKNREKPQNTTFKANK